MKEKKKCKKEKNACGNGGQIGMVLEIMRVHGHWSVHTERAENSLIRCSFESFF